VRQETGEVFLSDPWADQDIHYPGDSWNDVGTNLYGNFKAIYLLKKKNRHLKLLLSIGGWTYSPSFHPVVVDPRLRAEFVRSSVRLLEDYGLDGLDVDYEYPQNDQQARGYVELLRELRAALDEHARKKNADYRFLLTVRKSSAFCALLANRIHRSLHHAGPTTTRSYTCARWTSHSTSGT
jgi:chitinase